MVLNTFQKLCRLSESGDIFIEIRGDEIAEIRDSVTVRFTLKQAAKYPE
jgi:hypothetical protein